MAKIIDATKAKVSSVVNWAKENKEGVKVICSCVVGAVAGIITCKGVYLAGKAEQRAEDRYLDLQCTALKAENKALEYRGDLLAMTCDKMYEIAMKDKKETVE